MCLFQSEWILDKLKYTYSQLSSKSICRFVSENYSLTNILRCEFYVLGLHDNYLITCEHKKYILRIYRNTWRNFDEIQFELEWLTYLKNNQARVASPIKTNDNLYSFVIHSPEGERVGALFEYADGYAPGNGVTVEQSMLLGDSIAQIHQLGHEFIPNSSKHTLELEYLLNKSVEAIEPFISRESCNYLYSLRDKIHKNIPCLTTDHGEFGFCIGDVNSTNFHINENNEITLFDFDQCGYGYRAFEIGKFISSIHSLRSKDRISSAFIDGYQMHRKLSADEIRSIPYYELVSVIWVMAIHVYNVDRIGYKYLEKQFWDRKLEVLSELEQHLSSLRFLKPTGLP